jgi:hypothetical protein
VRVVSFLGPDGPRLGVVNGDLVVDLNAVDPAAPRDLREVLSARRLPGLELLALGAPPDARGPLDELQLGRFYTEVLGLVVSGKDPDKIGKRALHATYADLYRR